MNRQTLFNAQQPCVFDPLLSAGSSAIAPLFTEDQLECNFNSNSWLYDGLISGMTLSGSTQQCLQLIAPVLRELSDGQHDRWLTLISPPQHVTAQWLRDAGLNRERILVLRPRGLQSSQELAYEALRLGCSHTVVSWFNQLQRAARSRLTRAAHMGSAQCLNIRHTAAI